MDKEFLKKAIELSKISVERDGFPVGAIVVKNGVVVGEGLSDGKNSKDATSHAEIEAIRDASKKLDTRDLFSCTIYSSMEPCLMCLSASFWAKIEKIVFACSKERLAVQHFEGSNDLYEVNLKNNRQIELVYLKDLEENALNIISNWENSLK